MGVLTNELFLANSYRPLTKKTIVGKATPTSARPSKKKSAKKKAAGR
jgi:hypothetical protein